MPTISVIIPVYNGAKTILKTVTSVVEQIYQDWELIVINDGSQDDTLDILNQINDSRLAIYSFPNAGAAVSRNRGLELAKGDYIAFLDGDDRWTHDKLQLQLQTLRDYPQAAVAYSWTDYIDESDNFVQPGRHLTYNGDVLAKLLINNFLENGSNPLIKREALIKIGGFEPSLQGGQDWDLYLRLAQHYEFICVPQVQILYRVTTASISSNLQRQEQQCLQVLDRAFTQAPPSLQSLKNSSLANLYKYLTWKALQPPHSQHKGQQALYFIWKYTQYEPHQLREVKFILIMAFKGLKVLLSS